MEDKAKQSVEDAEQDENHYELDLDAHSSEQLNAVIEDAVASVDVDDEDGAAAEPAMSDHEVAQLRADRDRLRDGLKRTLADLANFRKRTEREKKSLSRFAVSEVIRDFLEVTDNLERAMAAEGSAEDLKKGLEMVLRQQSDVLTRHGVERIEAVGEEFDPAVHEAVMRQESDDVQAPTVSAELKKGYMHYDRLLRPATVTVTVPSQAAQQAAPKVAAGAEDDTAS